MGTSTSHVIPLSPVVRDSPIYFRLQFNPLDSEEEKKLVESIQALGQANPVCLWLILPGQFQVVYSHRRIDAMRHLGSDSVEAVLWDEEPDLWAMTDAYLLENFRNWCYAAG